MKGHYRERKDNLSQMIMTSDTRVDQDDLIEAVRMWLKPDVQVFLLYLHINYCFILLKLTFIYMEH